MSLNDTQSCPGRQVFSPIEDEKHLRAPSDLTKMMRKTSVNTWTFILHLIRKAQSFEKTEQNGTHNLIILVNFIFSEKLKYNTMKKETRVRDVERDEELDGEHAPSVETSRIYCPLSIDETPTPRLLTTKFTKSETNLLKNENSRTVKVMFLKFKCIVVFTVILIAFLEFIYICFKEFINNDALVNQVFDLIKIMKNESVSFFPNITTPVIEMINETVNVTNSVIKSE